MAKCNMCTRVWFSHEPAMWPGKVLSPGRMFPALHIQLGEGERSRQQETAVAKQRSSAAGLITRAGSHGQVISLSIKREGKPDIRRGQPCGADTQTERTCSSVSMTPKYQSSSPSCPVRKYQSSLQHDSEACSHFAVCGLFTVWVLPLSWENIPGLAEPRTWKEKATPALSVFLRISSYGVGSTLGVKSSGEAKSLH